MGEFDSKMKIYLLSFFGLSIAFYHGDGKCSRPVFGRRETCSGNNREDGCCSIDEICEFYSRLPDFKDHYEDFKGVFGNFNCGESTTFSPIKTTTPPVQDEKTTKGMLSNK